jgi:hypothetical protein
MPLLASSDPSMVIETVLKSAPSIVIVAPADTVVWAMLPKGIKSAMGIKRFIISPL